MENKIINELIAGRELCLKDENDFLNAVKDVSANTYFVPVEMRALEFQGIGDESALTSETGFDCGFSVIRSGEYGDKTSYSCRPYAVKTLCDRLGISGSVLSKFDNEKLARLLKSCAVEYSDGEQVQIAKIQDKCIAVLSGNYKVLPADTVFEEAVRAIRDLGGAYATGYVSLDLFYASYCLNNKELVNAYRDKFDEFTEAVPIVTIETSNTGLSSVSFTPKFKIKNLEIIVGKPLRALHKGDSDIAIVKENSKQIFAIFKAAIEGLDKLKKIQIEHPITCFKNVARRVLLPKKYSMMAAENFENFVEDGEKITAYDLYLALAEVMFYAESDDRPKTFITNLQEQVSRALYVDFGKYDIPTSEW